MLASSKAQSATWPVTGAWPVDVVDSALDVLARYPSPRDVLAADSDALAVAGAPPVTEMGLLLTGLEDCDGCARFVPVPLPAPS